MSATSTRILSRTVLCLLASALGACASGGALGNERLPGDPIAFGCVRQISSVVLGEDRTLNIMLPASYERSSEKYPVIYLLDGATHEDYHHVSGLVQFFSMYQLMPESILVGIANVDRKRDFTHHTSSAELQQAVPTGGGSAAFIQFLADELQPFIAKQYRTDGSSMIIGQSLGGLLATEVLLTRPELFDTYLIVSPSLWWDDASMIAGAGEFGQEHPDLAKLVFLSMGTELAAMHVSMEALLEVLEACGPGVQFDFLPLPEETHATVHHRAIYAGLEYFYGEAFPGL